MNIQWKKLAFCLALPLGVGALGALLGGPTGFDTLAKPPLSPPGWLFPLVWTALYLLMGYASYRVAVAEGPGKGQALGLYGAQLLVNLLWPLLFFRWGLYLPALLWLGLLWVLIYFTMEAFSRLDPLAGDLMLPYLLWVTFAGYLNFGVFLLNR